MSDLADLEWQVVAAPMRRPPVAARPARHAAHAIAEDIRARSA